MMTKVGGEVERIRLSSNAPMSGAGVRSAEGINSAAVGVLVDRRVKFHLRDHCWICFPTLPLAQYASTSGYRENSSSTTSLAGRKAVAPNNWRIGVRSWRNHEREKIALPGFSEAASGSQCGCMLDHSTCLPVKSSPSIGHVPKSRRKRGRPYFSHWMLNSCADGPAWRRKSQKVGASRSSSVKPLATTWGMKRCLISRRSAVVGPMRPNDAVEKLFSSAHRAVNRMEYQRSNGYCIQEPEHGPITNPSTSACSPPPASLVTGGSFDARSPAPRGR